jgi:pyruvate,water dikinase
MTVLTSASDPGQIRLLAGAKGEGLYRLTLAGLAVPNWQIIGSDAFRRHAESRGLPERISAVLAELSPGPALQSAAVEAASLIRAWITQDELAADITREVHEAYEELGAGHVAVRSSGSEEDGSAFSFAGQFATYLNVRDPADVADKVRECWASAFSARSLQYRLLHGAQPSMTGMAVIVQRMVRAEKSGVLFTANPTNGKRDERVISAVYGLGEGLVQGAVDADTVVLDSRNKVRHTVIGEKQERFDADPAGPGCVVRVTGEEDRQCLALSGDEVASLGRVADVIEDLHRCPQDVEWAFAPDGQLWVLQCRPITSPIETGASEPGDVGSEEFLRIWDNSNIIESFRGITSPLTYSFARRVYQKVYEEYARSLKIPDAQQLEMREWLSHLLGYINGHVYYNLLNWYRLVRLAPFYGIGRRSLEVSLGVDESLAEGLAEALQPFTFSSGRERLFVTAKSRFAFFRNFILIDRTVRNFLTYFSRTYQQFDGVDYGRLSADEVFRRYQILERKLVTKWGSVAILDAVIGISFGTLQALTNRWLPDAPPWFEWAVVSPGDGIESAEPARRITELARKVLADPALEVLVRETEAGKIRDALAREGYQEFLKDIDSYISAYGYRSVDELKLEVPDLREDPPAFFTLLRNALSGHLVRRDGGQDPDEYLDRNLDRLRRLVYELVRRKVRRSLSARENLRFCRTRAFGTAKKMMRAIGKEFARIGVIEQPEDIYNLCLEEIQGCFEATIMTADLRELIALRKVHEEANNGLTAPPRFSTRGPVYWLGNLDQARCRPVPELAGSLPGLLTGIAAAPGTAEGVAMVVDTPQEVNGGVLVTYRTDPGWVASLPSASALLVERGSPLTHVAIVARELRVPTVVQIKNLTQVIRTGMQLAVDGGTGQVRVIPEGEDR